MRGSAECPDLYFSFYYQADLRVRSWKERRYLTAPALHPGVYAPYQVGFAIFVEYVVVDLGVDIFRIYKGTIHIENTGTDWGKGGPGKSHVDCLWFVSKRVRKRLLGQVC